MKGKILFCKWIGFGLAVALGFLLCIGTSPVSAADRVLRFGLGTDVRILDPPDATDNTSELVILHIDEGLVAFNDKMEIVPQLAESWQYSDPTTLVFKLRRGVKFQDGTPFNAEAVRFHFMDRLLGPTPHRQTSLYSPYLQTVEVVDDYTVRFKLKKPFGAFLHHLAHVVGKIPSPTAVKKYGKDIGMHPVGTGPFELAERTPGERIVLKAFKGYWGGAPAIDEIDMPIIPEDATRSMMLQAGDLDLALRVPPDDIPRLKKDKNINMLIKPSVLNMYIGINTAKYPFNDKRVRQALNYAVDKKLISETLLTNVSTPADSPLSPATWGYYSTGLYPYDPVKAKALLAEAGWKPGAGGVLEKDGQPLKAQLWSPIGRYLKDTSVAEAVASQLRAVGVDVQLQNFEWGAFLSMVSKPRDAGQQELFLLAWGPSTADADWVLRPLFESDMVKPKGSNRFYFSNAEVDKLIEEQMNTVDPKQRYEICKQCQIKVMEEAPMIPIAALYQVIGVRSNVEGIVVLATDHVLATQAHFKK